MQNSLLDKIETLRQMLYRIAQNKKLSDPEVVIISQRLDQLLNQYQRVQNDAKEKSFTA